MTRTLVLASESTYRRALLDRLQIPYEARAHRLDERSYAATLPEGLALPQLALSLARAKAESICDELPAAYVLASDQIAAIDGEILHKPGSRDRAVQQLLRLRGKEHQLLTAIALRTPGGKVLTTVDQHRMLMRTLTNEEARRYVDAEQPFDCCGSYKIESLGISIFESIRGDDFTAITGLPLMAVSSLLRQVGFKIP